MPMMERVTGSMKFQSPELPWEGRELTKKPRSGVGSGAGVGDGGETDGGWIDDWVGMDVGVGDGMETALARAFGVGEGLDVAVATATPSLLEDSSSKACKSGSSVRVGVGLGTGVGETRLRND